MPDRNSPRESVSNLRQKVWMSLDSSGLQFRLTQPYENVVGRLCICIDAIGTLPRSLGATWLPEEYMTLARAPEDPLKSAKAVRSAMQELKHSYQFHVFSIFKCFESIWSSRGVRQ
jgi:hypothetical protein